MLVLLVDDDPDIRHLFTLGLELAGIGVVAVASFTAATARLLWGGVDVVVTDRWLDDGDGELLAAGAGLPAIVLSGSYGRVSVAGPGRLRVPKATRPAMLATLVREVARRDAGGLVPV